MPNSLVNWSTVSPESSRHFLTTGAQMDQWAQSIMWLKAMSTVMSMPASFCAEDSTTNGPPAMAPLDMPVEAPFSTTMTLLPARQTSMAAHMPAAPAPAITTSASRVSPSAGAAVCSSAASEAASSATTTLAPAAATAAAPLSATKLRRVILVSMCIPFYRCINDLSMRAAAWPAPG